MPNILKPIIKRINSIPRSYSVNKSRLKHLEVIDFTVTFPHEGNAKITLPKIARNDLITKKGRQMLTNHIKFSKRPHSEALLRKLVFNLYKNNIIEADKSIIDIGCWLGDNSIIWANLLNKNNAKVYAIDPSVSNIAYASSIAKLNGCTNIQWCEAVCSDKDNRQLYYQNKITHAIFNTEGIGLPYGKTTTTLDTIVGKDNWSSVGLLHVDVEGFEKQVIDGSENIIKNSQPIIIFEQHICIEDSYTLCKTLEDWSYVVYMINEVLPGCDLDCRNFMAIPKTIDVSALLEIDITKGRQEKIWYAVNGNSLIPYHIV